MSTFVYYNVNFHMQKIASFRKRHIAEAYAEYERNKRDRILESQRALLTAGEYKGLKTSVDRAVTVNEIKIEFSDDIMEAMGS